MSTYAWVGLGVVIFIAAVLWIRNYMKDFGKF